MSKLKVAVVGVGHLGQHHARILASLPDVELVAVSDTRAKQAKLVADRFHTVAVTDWRDLLGQVDAVSIAVPTSGHRQVASAFLALGCAAMVEKPLASNLEDAEAIVHCAQSSNAILQVGHIERFNPALATLDGRGLRPRYITAERMSTYTFRSTDIGVVLDLMIHDIDLLLSLVDSPVRRVDAVGVSIFSHLEDVANARIEFENGTVANLTASRASFQSSRKMRIWGAEGYASIDFATKQGTFLTPSDNLRSGIIDLEGVDMSQPSLVKDHLFGTILEVEKVQAEGREPLALELEDFVHAVRTGERPKVTGADALKAVQLADRIIQSIKAHQWDKPSAIPRPKLFDPRYITAESGEPVR